MYELEGLTVYLDDSMPEYMSGLVRCGRVVAMYSDGSEKDFDEYVDNSEYDSKRSLVEDVAKDFGVAPEFIEVVG
nr:hypothetical protein [Halomonas socia]